MKFLEAPESRRALVFIPAITIGKVAETRLIGGSFATAEARKMAEADFVWFSSDRRLVLLLRQIAEK